MTDKYNDDKEADSGELVMGEEKREHPRVALSVPIRYSVVKEEPAQEHEQQTLFDAGAEKDEKAEDSESQNLSSGGMLMSTKEHINPKSVLHISMYIPLPGLACNCAVLADVVRCDKKVDAEGYDTAVKFIKIVHHNLNKYKYANLQDVLNVQGPKIHLD